MTKLVITNILVLMELAEEIKQTKPFSSKEQEVFLNIQRTAEVLGWTMAEILKPFELTQVQYNVLRILRGAGEAGIKCSEISERMVTKDSDITRLLDRLENRGLVVRERDEKDRRAVITRITEEGQVILAQLEEPVLKGIKGVLGHLGNDLLEQLNALLVLARAKVK